ncbi:HAD-IA family hydrolase [Silvimonas sp. JCM 19000]
MPRHHALAFLFDMDGTLIDSHVLVDRTWSAWCARRGFDLEEIRPYTHGVRTEDTLRMVAPHLDVATEVAWMEEIETDTSGGIKLVPNAGHFLARVPDEHWAVVTSASRPVLDARFEACGLVLPRAVVTSETVSRGKPSPEPYLQAAEKLGIHPRDCIVFEDAPAGMESALAAGCRVVLVGGLQSTERGVIGAINDYAELELDVHDGLTLSVPESVAARYAMF